MTKVTVFGQEEAKKGEKKAIELCKVLTLEGASTVSKTPEDWDEVCLVQKDYIHRYDLAVKDYIYRYDLILGINYGTSCGSSGYTCAYLGHWNDGVV